MLRRLSLAVASTAVLGLVSAIPALAHANLERADPAPGASLDQPPHELRLQFSEAVDQSFSKVQVLNDRKDQLDRGDSRVSPNDPRTMLVSLPDQLANVVYTVNWRTLSAVDGHTVNGAYPLVIGPIPAEGLPVAAAASSEATFAPETAVARWWFFVGASGVFGSLLAWQLVFAPLFGRNNPAAVQVASQRTRQVIIVAGVVLLIGVLYGAIAQAAVAAGVPIWGAFGQPLVDLLSRGRYATLWWPRLLLVVLAVAFVGWAGVKKLPGQIALAASGVALLTSSLNSHAAALLSGAYLGVAVDWLHLMAAAAWVGGLLSLTYVLPRTVRATQANGDRILAGAVGRFSTLAIASVGVIIVTGTFQAWLEVGSWEGLFQTLYGLSVTTKIVLLAVTMVIAGFNLFIARPQLAALAVKQSAAASVVARRFAVAVRIELTLLTVV